VKADPLLADPSPQSRPFPFFRFNHAFGPEECATLDVLFSARDGWQARDEAFYSCFLRDVSAEVSPDLLRDVLARMRTITGLPLTEKVVVSAQRMDSGQAIGVHSDRPSLGYEIARLVVSLNPRWRPEDGGVLELYEAPEGSPVESIEPDYDVAFAFILHETSHHGVSRVTRTRRTVVFNFWHAANTPELADAVASLFVDMHFSELPSALDPIAAAAESDLAEDITFRASSAALALHRWGFDQETVVSGFRFSAGLEAAHQTEMDESAAAVHLADYVARLQTDPFDVQRWNALRNALASMKPFPRLMPLWRLCLPAFERT
jgi:2OG-Fe(II) oxygenase superfamily